jgi:hypothetical protein
MEEEKTRKKTHKEVEQVCATQHLTCLMCSGESASSPLVGFGWLNDNVIKDLTYFLSVDRK